MNFLEIFYATGYGVLSIDSYILALVFATLNRVNVSKISKKSMADTENNSLPGVSVHAVGYREDPECFKKFLQSASNIAYSNLKAIIVVIYGDEEENREIVDIAMQLWPDAARIPLSSVPARTLCGLSIRKCSDYSRRAFVLPQPHAGEREVLYAAYKISQALRVDYFMNTDSDTMLDPNCVREMVNMTDADKGV